MAGMAGFPGKHARRACLTAMFVGAILSAHDVRADLINPQTLTDLPLVFGASAEDTVLAAAGPIVFGGVNWRATAEQGDFDLQPDGVADDILVTVQHLVAPHAGEAQPNTEVTLRLLNLVVDGPGVIVATATPSHAPDQDQISASYFDLAVGGSRLLIAATHSAPIPESSTLFLFGFSLAGLGGLGFWRWRNSHRPEDAA